MNCREIEFYHTSAVSGMGATRLSVFDLREFRVRKRRRERTEEDRRQYRDEN